jgi:phosphohistidine phosphatase
MDLYLIRHGVAFDADPSRWPDDSQRPLTPEGEKRFRRTAEGLGALQATVGVVLSSPWPRAWRTAELLQAGAGWPEPKACGALESGRPPAEVMAALQPYRQVEAVALVGHEPNMSELVSYLLTGDTDLASVEMKRAGWLGFGSIPASHPDQPNCAGCSRRSSCARSGRSAAR